MRGRTWGVGSSDPWNRDRYRVLSDSIGGDVVARLEMERIAVIARTRQTSSERLDAGPEVVALRKSGKGESA